ncbi:ATP-binding protein [Bdellovibrionota bacterium FG-1]
MEAKDLPSSPNDSHILSEFRAFGLRSLYLVVTAMTLMWALVSLFGVMKLVESRRASFEAIVESHQESIVSGQHRQFLEGLARDLSQGFFNTQICWQSERDQTCEGLTKVASWLSRLTSIRVQVPVSNGSEIAATVVTSVSLEPAILLSLLILTSFTFTGGVLWLAMKSLINREQSVRRSLADAVLTTVQEGSVQSLMTLPVEIRPIAEALLKSIADLQTTKNEKVAHEAIAQLASQVAHDIRSPLSALTMAEKEFSKLPEETRLIVRSAVGRIRDIANTLLERNRAIKVNQESASGNTTTTAEPRTIQLLSAILDGIVSEKRMQFRPKLGVNIEFEDTRRSYGRFASIQTGEFKRMVSNLINNAVEALPDSGQVFVTLNGGDAEVVIKVRDTGKGIPPEILAKLGRQGETHGKTDGNGLGLYHARTQCEAWGGSLVMTSQVGEGTTVTITLPRTSPPEWFVAELKLQPNSTVVVLDDDDSIHRIWQGRADSEKLLEQGITLIHLSTPSDICRWHAESMQKGLKLVQYLCDYELLGFDETGLDLIEKLGIASQSILVTSRYEEPTIRERCNKLRVPLIPKGNAAIVPIAVTAAAPAPAPETTTPDAILIDDDDLIHLTWKAAAKRKGLSLLAFKSVDEFLRAAELLSRSTPVYIDSYLGNDSTGKPVQGEEASRDISAMGFKEIYLATGLAPANPERYTWLTGIRDKDPPFDEMKVTPATSVADEAPVAMKTDYAKVRNYCHDLLKPVQQASNILRMLDNVNLDDPTDPDSLSDYLPLLDGVGKTLTSQRNHRLQMRAEMTAGDLARVADLDDRLMKAYDEVQRSAVCSPDQIVGLKRSGELSQRFKLLQAESSYLAQASATLLNQSQRYT